MKIDTSNYDYTMFVDASGDDGFKFENGSTKCYVAAALTIRKEDIPHNLDILTQIKQIIGCKPADEVKYSRIRRHKYGNSALSLLRDLRGAVSCQIVFKKEVDKAKYVGNKKMSIICHMMALRSLRSGKFNEEDKVLVVIDRMKQTEEKPLKELMDEGWGSNSDKSCGFDIIFRDSKDSNFLLLQIADLLCGAIREHFEQYESQEDMLYFAKKCPPCYSVLRIRGKPSHPLCQSGRSRAIKIINSSPFKFILPLFPNSRKAGMISYCFMEPPQMFNRHFYLICSRI